MAATPVEAQERDEARAREHFVAAQAHEKAGDYEAAALEYLKAYEYFPSPELHYNAGRAYELHGDAARAVEHYEEYVSLDPTGRAVDDARAAIAKLKPQIDEKEAGAEEPEAPADAPEAPEREAAGEPAAEPGAGEGGDAAGEGKAAPQETETAPPDGDIAAKAVAARAPRDEGSRTVRIAGMVAAGAGLAATALGVKYAMDASRLNGEIEGVQDQWTEEDLAKFDEGERARTMSFTFTGIGIAALLAGGGLYLWGRGDASADERERTSLLPLVSPSGTGFVVTRRF